MRSLKEEVEGSSSSKYSPPNEKEERQEKTTFTVLQKNTSSMSSSERFEELLREVQKVKWDMATEQRNLGNRAKTHCDRIR